MLLVVVGCWLVVCAAWLCWLLVCVGVIRLIVAFFLVVSWCVLCDIGFDCCCLVIVRRCCICSVCCLCVVGHLFARCCC